MNSKEWKKWLYWFSLAVVVIIVYKTIDSVTAIFTSISQLFDILMPFVLAILIAYILYIPSKKVENLYKKYKFLEKHSRGLSIFTVYVITILLIFIIIDFVIPSLTTSIKDLISNLPNYYTNAVEYIDNLDEDAILAKLNIKEYINKLEQINFIEGLTNFISVDKITSYLKGIVDATGIIFDAFVTVIVSIYMLLERTKIKNFLQNLVGAIFDEKTTKMIARYFKRTNSIFFSYISGQIIDAFVVGIITSIVMTIMNVKYAVLLGFVIGLFNIIPYFGAIVGVILAIIITIFTGGITKAIWLAILVIVLQQIDANIINPKILGTSLNLSPILIIFAVTVGGSYFGVLGMFLGVPVIAFIKLILCDFIEFRQEQKEKMLGEFQ